MFSKETYCAIGIVVTLLAYYPYVRSIWKGDTKPHVFTWLIWGITTFLAFLAQMAGGAGIGGWPTGVSGIICIYVAFLAFMRRADSRITRLDWLFMWSALSALPLWWLTANPLWATVILTTVDLLGFGPTMRKVYSHPYQEHLAFYVILTARNVVVLLALEHYSLTTILFPAAVALGCLVFIIEVLWRRRVLGAPGS